jgi:pimeloyl-ACP methyl ester carboxylesterase
MTNHSDSTNEFDSLQATADELGISWDGPPPSARRQVTTPDGSVSAVVWGTDPARSVLLHGRGPTQSARSWDAVALEWGAPTVAIDFPGHGFSERRADRRYTPRLVAGALAQGIEELAPVPTSVIGVSFGGLTAIALAAARPDLVDRLVLVDVLPWVAHPPAAPAAGEALPTEAPPIPTFASQEAIVDELVAAGSPRSRSALTRNVAANTEELEDGQWAWRFDPGVSVPFDELDLPGLWDDLVKTPVPVLLVRGGSSPVVADEAVDALLAGRSDITVVTVAESGHEVHDERPRELAAILRDADSASR